jgi:hypothetical protein
MYAIFPPTIAYAYIVYKLMKENVAFFGQVIYYFVVCTITTLLGGGQRIFQHKKGCFRRDFKPEKKTTFEADNY